MSSASSWAVRVTSSEDATPLAAGSPLHWRDGLLEELLAKGPGAYVLAAPSTRATFAEKGGEDADQLATLKALGYVQ